MDLDQNRLTIEQLTKLGRVATEVKQRFRIIANDTLVEGVDAISSRQDDANGRPVILKRGYTRDYERIRKMHMDHRDLIMTDISSHKPKKRYELTCVELVAIVDSVRHEKLSHKETATKHSVSPSLVQRLVKESKTDLDFPKKIRDREMKRKEKLRAVVNQSLKHLQSTVGL